MKKSITVTEVTAPEITATEVTAPETATEVIALRGVDFSPRKKNI